MNEIPKKLQSAKGRSLLLVVYVPSHTRDHVPLENQQFWVDELLTTLGIRFGGATAYPRGQGIWRDDRRGGVLVRDEPVVVQCFTSFEALDANSEELLKFLVRMGTQTQQGAVGYVVNGEFHEIDIEETGGS